MQGFDTSIPFRALPDVRQFDPLANALKIAQLRALRQEGQSRDLENQMAQIKLADLVRQQNEQQAIRSAAQGAVTPAQSSSYQEPTVSLGDMTLPGKTVGVSTPASFNRDQFLSNLTQSNPLAADSMRQQFATQDIGRQQALMQMQEQALKLSSAQRAEASAQLEKSVKGFYAVEALPPEQRPIAYQHELKSQLEQGIIHPQQVGTELPSQYPGPQGMASILMRAGSIKEILDRINNSAPLSPDEAQVLGKQPGQSVSIDLKNKASEILNRGRTTVNTDEGVYDYNRITGQKTRLGANPRNVFAPENKIVPVAADPNNPGAITYMRAGQAMNQGVAAPQSAATQAAKGELKYMTSGKGGQQITAYNTAIAHLDTLQRLAGDLNNTDIQVANRAKQAWAEQTGNPAPANFAAAVNAMSGEVAAALKASGATDDEIKKVDSTFNRAQSPAQLNGAINTYRELLKSKAAQLQKQFETGIQAKPAFGQDAVSDPFAQFGGVRH